MAVSDQIIRQNSQTMNLKTMLADFLSFVTPRCMHNARFSAVGAAVQSLMQNGQCTVTAVGRDFDSGTSEKHGIKRVEEAFCYSVIPAVAFMAHVLYQLVFGNQVTIIM